MGYADSLDPDQTLLKEQSDQDLHCHFICIITEKFEYIENFTSKNWKF